MQFTTATWSDWGVDASGDGLASPHNAFDAIATAGRYLCAGRPELASKDDLERAVRRYNNSAAYVRAVLEKAYEYGMTDGGDAVLGLLTATGAPIGQGPQIAGSAAPVVAYALAQVGDPYVWGAAGPNAFDCSGLTMAAYRQIGIRLPHRSNLQVRYGKAIDWRAHPVQAGDLIFLRGGSPVHDYGHVGIAIDSDRWVVAPRTGEDVHVGSIPFSRVQAVRRIVTQK
jgi:cell wall-associated NlpC family hydrolase